MSKGGTEAPSVGFTIVEVMIVLAVSSLMVVSAALIINGRQQKAEFTTGINDTKQRLEQIINETGSGYFPNSGGFSCKALTDKTVQFIPPAAASGGAQGSSAGCVFLGKGIQFGLSASGDETQIAVIPIVGRQNKPESLGTGPIETLQQAVPRAAYYEDHTPHNATVDDDTSTQAALNNLTIRTTLPYGMHIAKTNQRCTGTSGPAGGALLTPISTPAPVCYSPSIGTNIGTGMVLFLAGDSSGNIASSTGGTLDSGTQQMSLYGVDSSAAGSKSWVGDSPGAAVGHMGIFAGSSYTLQTGYVKNAAQALICITDDTQSGLFTINAGLSVDLQIFQDATC